MLDALVQTGTMSVNSEHYAGVVGSRGVNKHTALVVARDHPAFRLRSLPRLLKIHSQQVSGRRSDEGIELLEVVTATHCSILRTRKD